MSREPGQRDLPELVEPRHRRAEIVFGAAAFLVALFLFSQLGEQTRWIPGRPFISQPALWPAISIGGMLLFGAFELAAAWRRNRSTRGDGIFAETLVWVRAVEYVVWFMAYVAVVPIVGYLPTTVAFCAALTWRLGYRRFGMMTAAIVTGIVTVVAFKSFLSVRIPGGALYGYLPDAIRNLFIQYF